VVSPSIDAKVPELQEAHPADANPENVPASQLGQVLSKPLPEE
jgi:hypothetical protein